MTDVFISYARSTQEQAQSVEEALRSAGYDVWRDSELPAHRTYAEVIEERLKSAKAVVVLWSAEASKSQWVRAEADAARGFGTLVQASVDSTMPPIPFNQIQFADLQGWKGEGGHAGWRKLAASIEALTGRAGGAEKQPGPRRHRTSVCVLPFANMSGDAEQEYFSDGISEDITTDLSKVSALEVIARNTAFQFKGQSIDVGEIARKLGVSHVLEGSVRKAGNRVRITAQLIDGTTGGHVWAERFDRDLTDIFAIQDEISKAIVEALRVRLLPEEIKAIEQRGTANADAYNLYLMARNYWVTGNYGDPRRSERVINICKRAVEIDPNYGRAWALMALAQTDDRFEFSKEAEDGLAAAERALNLDPAIAEAHCVKARHLSEQGKAEEADAEIAVALSCDPESWDVNRQAGRQMVLGRRMDEAAAFYEKAASLIENDFHSWGPLIMCYRAQRNERGLQRAAKMLVEKAGRALTEDPSNGSAITMIAGGFALLGERQRAKEWIERALLIDPHNMTSRYNFACVLANELNEPEAAVILLGPVFSTMGESLLKYMEADPDFDRLRDHPRFQEMVAAAKKRLGIEDEIVAGTGTGNSERANPAATSAPLRS